jgi:hypothetical protein
VELATRPHVLLFCKTLHIVETVHDLKQRAYNSALLLQPHHALHFTAALDPCSLPRTS